MAVTEPVPSTHSIEHAAELRLLIQQLSDAYGEAHAAIVEQSDRDGAYIHPLRAMDTNGRYILLDALTALVQARAALLVAEVAGL
jgi:hypothetical protein